MRTAIADSMSDKFLASFADHFGGPTRPSLSTSAPSPAGNTPHFHRAVGLSTSGLVQGAVLQGHLHGSLSASSLQSAAFVGSGNRDGGEGIDENVHLSEEQRSKSSQRKAQAVRHAQRAEAKRFVHMFTIVSKYFLTILAFFFFWNRVLSSMRLAGDEHDPSADGDF